MKKDIGMNIIDECKKCWYQEYCHNKFTLRIRIKIIQLLSRVFHIKKLTCMGFDEKKRYLPIPTIYWEMLYEPDKPLTEMELLLLKRYKPSVYEKLITDIIIYWRLGEHCGIDWRTKWKKR